MLSLTSQGPYTPRVKFRKYFNFAGMSENTLQSFNMEVYENFFLVEFLVFQVARKTFDFTTYLVIYYHFY